MGKKKQGKGAAAKLRSVIGWPSRAWRWMDRQARIDAFRFSAAIFLAMVVAVSMGWSAKAAMGEAAESAQVLALPTATLKQIKDQLDRKQVASVTYNTIEVGSLITPRAESWAVIELKEGQDKAKGVSGRRERVRQNELLGEAGQKALFETALADNIEFRQGFAHGTSTNKVMALLQTILFFTFIIVILLVAQRAAGDLLVGKSFNPKQQNEDIGFDDIVGYEEVKREMREVIDQMRRSKDYAKMGMKAPRGILLLGGPGVGKTMMAKALANECKAAFFYATGSDFVEMYVGVGARRVRSLFKQAQMSGGPAVIFIDEIDALGSRGGYGMDSERLATINQMLAQMDGFEEAGQILVVGATNHAESLDPALLRPGRFDKKITVPSPDLATRRGILQRELSDARLSPDVDLEALALRSAGYSGAALKSWVAEAKQIAMREGSVASEEEVQISHELMSRAQEVALLGYTERKPSARELRLVAVHELGHALVGKLACPEMAIDKVAVGGRGGALGFTMQRPTEEKSLHSKAEMLGQMAMLLGGRAAEEVFFGDITSGSSDDISRANDLARKMVCDLGMGSRSSLLTHKAHPQAPGELPAAFREDVQEMLAAQYERAKAIVAQRRGWMEGAAERLLSAGSLEGEALFEGLEELSEAA